VKGWEFTPIGAMAIVFLVILFCYISYEAATCLKLFRR
jgi:hypothetical protein